jgi:hypothetical protein
MLMGSVAAAATATTLLSPESLSTQPSRSTAQSAMQTIIERLRPQRNSRTNQNQSVEAALGDYLRTVLRDNRRFAEAVAGDTPNAANVPAEFQDFLHTLQEDLIQAVRAYAVPDAAGEGEEADDDVEVPAADIPPSSLEEASSASSTSTATSSAATDSGTETSAHASTSATTTEPESPTIPTFHHQRGQNLPGAHRPLGVSGGSDGTPRRLNFFRAHLFPTVHADGSVVTPNPSEGQEEAIVPSMTTEDLVAHPSFPFMDGQVPEDVAAAATATGSSPATSPVAMTQSLPEDDHDFDRDLEQELAGAAAASSSGDAERPRRSLRTRVLERFGAARREPRASPPLNTYLIYVIGGNYPRSHPVLSIPSLVSGGPLTAEDLQLLSELLGPAKPPTVTQEEIEASGLKVIKANTLTQAVQDSQVLDSSTERCMVSLLLLDRTDPRCVFVTMRRTTSAACSSAGTRSTRRVWTSGSRRDATRARRAAQRRSTRAPSRHHPRSRTLTPSRRVFQLSSHLVSVMHVCTLIRLPLLHSPSCMLYIPYRV